MEAGFRFLVQYIFSQACLMLLDMSYRARARTQVPCCRCHYCLFLKSPSLGSLLVVLETNSIPRNVSRLWTHVLLRLQTLRTSQREVFLFVSIEQVSRWLLVDFFLKGMMPFQFALSIIFGSSQLVNWILTAHGNWLLRYCLFFLNSSCYC